MSTSTAHIRTKRKLKNTNNDTHRTRYDARSRSRSRSRGGGGRSRGGRSRGGRSSGGRPRGGTPRSRINDEDYPRKTRRTSGHKHHRRNRESNRFRSDEYDRYDGDRHGNGYDNRYGNRYGNRHDNRHDNRYDYRYDNRYDNPYGKPETPIHNRTNHNIDRGVMGDHNHYNNGGTMGDNNRGVMGNHNSCNNYNYYNIYKEFLCKLDQKSGNEKIAIISRLLYKKGHKLITSGADLMRYCNKSIEHIIPIVFPTNVSQNKRMDIVNTISSQFGLKMKQLHGIVYNDYCNINLTNWLNDLSQNSYHIQMFDILLLIVINNNITDEKDAILRMLREYTIVRAQHINVDDFEELNERYKENKPKLKEAFKLIDDSIVKTSNWLGLGIKIQLKVQYDKYTKTNNNKYNQIMENKLKCYGDWDDHYLCELCGVKVAKLFGKEILDQQIKVINIHEETEAHKERLRYKQFNKKFNGQEARPDF